MSAGRQHAEPDRRTAEERGLTQVVRHRRFEPAHERHEHEQSPQAIHDRRDGGEELGEENQRLTEPRRTELRQVGRNAERDRRGDDQRENRRIDRAPDERPRAELRRDRIPCVGDPEVEAELANRENRLAEEDDADRNDDGEDESCKGSRPQPESDDRFQSWASCASLYLDPVQLLDFQRNQLLGQPRVPELTRHGLSIR